MLQVYAVVSGAMHICGVRSFCSCLLLLEACVLFLCGVRCCDACLSVCPHLHMWFQGIVGCTFQPYWSEHLEGLDGAFYSQ